MHDRPRCYSLLDLNSDVLVQLFEELRPRGHLRALSESCRYARSLAMPVLFDKCRVRMKVSLTSEFLPVTLWPYVHSLLLVDECPLRNPRDFKHRTDTYVYSDRYSNDPLLCGVLDAGVLRRTLPAMPRLYSISVKLPCREVHGIPHDVAAALLSAPQVRELQVWLFLFCPRQTLAEGSLHDIPPLTSFRYTKNPLHTPPRSHPSEIEAVRVVVTKLHASLESLELPIETTPLDVMSRLYWPRLRHLILHGESPTGFPMPIISVICRMPQLRILTLDLTILPKTSRQCVWPPTWTVDDTLPQIEELTVTHPHPEDLLYTHLPTSVRRLSLCCSPCYALQVWYPDDYRRWKSPLPSASELLRILSGSSMPHLTHLAIDYSPDHQEHQLLQHLYGTYAHLSSLELHRMVNTSLDWPEDAPTVNFVLSGLARLHYLDMLRLNFNLSLPGWRYGSERKFMAWVRTRWLEIAQAVAPMLGPSVTLLSLLAPASTAVSWIEYRISAPEGTKRAVSVVANPKRLKF